ncbi:hypothetical protein, partial [Echinicola sediminis]
TVSLTGLAGFGQELLAKPMSSSTIHSCKRNEEAYNQPLCFGFSFFPLAASFTCPQVYHSLLSK